MDTIRRFNGAEDTATLVLAARRGDRDAFGELFTRFRPQVHAIVLRQVGNYGDAAEITQDVFVKAMVKLDQLRSPESFPAWLRAIARRMSINRLNKKSAATSVEQETLDYHCFEQKTPLCYALDRERDGQVHAGMDRLGSMDREALSGFYLRGMSLRDMSEQFNAPIGTIKRRLHTARQRLSTELAMQ